MLKILLKKLVDYLRNQEGNKYKWILWLLGVLGILGFTDAPDAVAAAVGGMGDALASAMSGLGETLAALGGGGSDGLAGMLGEALFGGCGVSAASVAGVAALGAHTDGVPVTAQLADEVSPGLLRNEIDDRIVKIRPMSTPLDQISRYGGSRLCGSMKVDYYSVDTRPVSARTTAAFAGDNDRNPTVAKPAKLMVENADVFQPSTTVIVPDVKGSAGGSLVLYVTECDATSITVLAVNNTYAGSEVGCVPSIPPGTMLVRMGRAAGELDVTTSQSGALPVKSTNYCQIFKAQVEQSTFVKIANKEVGWTFSDQEEAAIIDMRMGMEKNFLFGHKKRLAVPGRGDEILLTGGIWNQTENEFEYSELKGEETLVALCKQAFAHNAGSSRKILLAGTGLIEKLHNLDHRRVVMSDQAVTKWGLDFTEIHSKFGTLYVLLSEVFDQCGRENDGMVVDPEYITKYCHVPFRTERLDLRSAGVRNVDAIVITEASCLVLRYPQSHMRVVFKETASSAPDPNS